MKKSKKVLNRAEDIILKYHDDESVYYQELLKSYNEYVNLSTLDKTTNELYINHISGLCNMIVEKKNSKLIVVCLITLLFFMFCFSTFSTYNYFKMSNDINGILHRGNATLSVNYGNLENFKALTLSNMADYKDLHPITLSLSSNSDTHEYMKYNIYLVEDNDSVDKDKLMNRNVFLYNVKSSTKNSGVKALKDSTYKDGRLLIYSSSFDPTTIEDIEIRMWINDKEVDFANKTYRFKIYVEGYL